MQEEKTERNETARQAYIRILRERVDKIESFNPKQRDVVLYAELINDECLDGVVHPNGSGFPIGYSVMGIKPKGRLFLQQLQKEELDASVARTHREAFTSLDRRWLSEKDDLSLAKWQSDYKPDEPEWRLAEYEWQRRLTEQQIEATMKAARWKAWSAVASAVIGAILGAVLTLVGQRFQRVPVTTETRHLPSASVSVSNSVFSVSSPVTNVMATNLPAPPTKP
jgi:hypothetical protein